MCLTQNLPLLQPETPPGEPQHFVATLGGAALELVFFQVSSAGN
jgi:hypothetical protein